MVFFIYIKWYFNKSSYKQSHSRNVVYLHKQLHLASISLLDESAFLHVVKWMIQWLILYLNKSVILNGWLECMIHSLRLFSDT